MNKLWSCLILAGTLFAPNAASAYCGSFNGDAGNNTMIVGVLQYWSRGSPSSAATAGPEHIGVVWNENGGSGWRRDSVAGCNELTPSNNEAVINGLAGDDTIIIYPEYASPFGDTNYENATGIVGFRFSPIDFSNPVNTIRFRLTGGLGSDRVYGGIANDRLYSNNFAAHSDGAIDYVCGRAGSDFVGGDYDGSPVNPNAYDCLSGGSGAESDVNTCYSADAYTPDYDGHDLFCNSVSPVGGSTLAFRYYSCSPLPCGWRSSHPCAEASPCESVPSTFPHPWGNIP